MRLLLSVFFIFFSLTAFSNPGDTTNITVHQDVDMVTYSQYRQWGEFPSAEDNIYRKVTMEFVMACASTGCSGWDYDVHIYARKRTGIDDSTLVLLPSFKVNGQTLDSISFSNTQTYTNNYSDSLGSESVANDTITITHFDDVNDPTLLTSTEYVFAANYYDYMYDGQGNVTDSTIIAADDTYFLTTTDSYNVFEVINDYELGRAITPYGTYMNSANGSYGTNGYQEDWKHSFFYDVTDFQNLFKDSVELSAFYAGWSSGFSVTLNFEFIEGTPPRDIIKLENVYKNGASGYDYNSSNDFESNQMPAKTLATEVNATNFKLQMVPTGHGQAGEFTPGVYYTLMTNGNNSGSNQIWKDDCGANAIWPQGGTWIFDRANWCPGEATPIFNHEIGQYITPGQSVELDINFSSFNPSASASYKCAVQFFQYKAYNNSLDAEIIDIVTPTTKDIHKRSNPSCGRPVIKIKNAGSTTLTTLDIEYNIKGGTVQTYQWTGNLESLQTEIVTLDAMILNGTSNVFEAKVMNPNGEADQYADNNYMQSMFEEVPVLPYSFIVRLKTNSQANQNSWNIEDANGEIEYYKAELSNSSLYLDTVILTNGCHKFNFFDNGGDGLDFWYWNQYDNDSDGTGFVSLKSYFPTSSELVSFVKDFGSGVNQSFIVEDYVTITENNLEDIAIFPNPTSGKIVVTSSIPNNQNINIEVINVLGKVIYQKEINYGLFNKKIDISNHKNGAYLLKISSEQSSITQRIILSR